MLDISVIVPARNAEAILEGCLQSIAASQVREIIVIDGCSTDRTVEIAQRYATRVESDEGRGLPAARLLGARLASSETVALVDADVVLPEGSLQRLIDEFRDDGYDALQAGLRSISAGDYWGEALATHHRWGRSKNWFGLVATVFNRSTLLAHGFDSRFVSGGHSLSQGLHGRNSQRPRCDKNATGRRRQFALHQQDFHGQQEQQKRGHGTACGDDQRARMSCDLGCGVFLHGQIVVTQKL